jgi:hypothetical protein
MPKDTGENTQINWIMTLKEIKGKLLRNGG